MFAQLGEIQFELLWVINPNLIAILWQSICNNSSKTFFFNVSILSFISSVEKFLQVHLISI